MSFPKSTATTTPMEHESTPESSVFDSFRYRGSIMTQKRRFNQTAKPKLQDSRIEPANKTHRSKSTKLGAKSNSSEPHISLAKTKILPRNFFQIDALDLAPRLLGKFLRRDDVVLQITEVHSSSGSDQTSLTKDIYRLLRTSFQDRKYGTEHITLVEAYRPNDSACHGRFGITSRTAPVFGPGGHAYVYLCYGLHMMLNVVADKEGAGAAVLIRSCAPISGLDIIQQRRGQKTDKPVLLTGPGKVGQALGLSTDWSNHPLYTLGGLELLDGPEPKNILVGPRVGIQYALPEHVNALWRFAIAGTPWISAPKTTLRPPPI